MVLKLDPRFPLVWRSPHSAQLGVAPPLALFERLSRPQERMLAALAEGISETGLRMTGRAAGASERDVASFLSTVTPALERARSTRARVHVAGTSRTATVIARELSRDHRIAPSAACDFVVIVAHYVVPPELHSKWLRRDIPHLAVVISDSTVEFSPVIEPGVSPCLLCLLADKVDRDSAWPAIAAQAHGLESAAENEGLAGEVAARAARVVRSRLATGEIAASHSTSTLDLATGDISRRPVARRPGCGCEELSAEVRPENGSLGGAPVVTLRQRLPQIPPTRERADAERA